jgi:4-aminobutyrate aminotransferase-like enzyme/Ser/Thr protein kinase RdoA (MazF antagonist)
MGKEYSDMKVSHAQARGIALDLYGIKGEAAPLPGELDFNFRLDADGAAYLLKVSRPGADQAYLEFQQAILQHVAHSDPGMESPLPFKDLQGKAIGEWSDPSGRVRKVRLYSWISGRLWSTVNPVRPGLLLSLGEQAGRLTGILQGFDHPLAHRPFEWDLAQAGWTRDHLHLFAGEKQDIVRYFLDLYDGIREDISTLRTGVVHNDANDNNVVVSEDLAEPAVKALIDFGDAIHTQIINDVAVTVAYAVMDKPDPLGAALPVIEGYHSRFPLTEAELELLYPLVAVRLLISVTKSALNRKAEPGNDYLLISEVPAWDLLKRWRQVHREFALCSFRKACGYDAHPREKDFRQKASGINCSLQSLFPTLEKKQVHPLDLGLASPLIGNREEAGDLELLQFRMERLQSNVPDKILAGGYLEPRALYTSEAYDRTGNQGRDSRTIHLGIDFWVPAGTPVHALFEGEVVTAVNDRGDKEYGGLIILKHLEEGVTFYSLYGHQSLESVTARSPGEKIPKGALISRTGPYPENGNWVPHLHFQLMLTLLGYRDDFPGVAYPGEVDIWKSICPDPNLLFDLPGLQAKGPEDPSETLAYRKLHLGRSLSLSYRTPLKILRGDGAWLIDHLGRRYLDTVNNVAHVGHEHPRVVRAGQKQMAVLNTNTRYLHDQINEFARELLTTLPNELSVVHLVNSGSEANELALRMARAFTGQKDMVAVEVGYHGNTTGCVDISSYKFDGKGGSGAPEYTHVVPLPDRFRGIHRGDDTGASYAAYVREQIGHIRAKGREPAGFICESILSCGGQVELPDRYLELAYSMVREAGGLCIADEVQVGCGRVGKTFWGFQLHGVIPDIVTIGKPIGNGHPLAAVVCTPAVAEAFANGMEYFNTFGGNPVSCAIGTEVLRVIRDEGLQENALAIGNYLKEELTKWQPEFPVIGDIRGQGLFLGIELADPDRHPLTEKAAYLADRMRELGFLMSTDGRDVNVMKIKPPMVIDRSQANELLGALRRVFQEDMMQLP